MLTLVYKCHSDSSELKKYFYDTNKLRNIIPLPINETI